MSEAEGKAERPGGAGAGASREALLAAIARDAPEVLALSEWMAAHPELALEEHETCRRYLDFLAGRGFRITHPVAGMPTAFCADRTSGAAEGAVPVVALLAEMDALPEVGHACGHDLSGPASLLAAGALAAVLPERTLAIRVLGCPAEEIGEGKRRLVEAGCFDGVDAAMMAHAADMRRAHRLFLGNRKYDLIYRGRAAHAAAYPECGVNALDAVVACYVSLGLLRQQLPPGVRLHVVIREGGDAPNVIPERALARVWVRALDEAELAESASKVLACAEAAALATGARLEVVELPGWSPPMRPNAALAECYRQQLAWLGLPETAHAPDAHIGSSDITHVSQVVPTIHPNFPIGRDLQLHTRAFARATTGPLARNGLLEAARALALSAREFALCETLRATVAREAAGV